MNNDTLLAIPFFTFMGLVLERSGMAEDLLDTIGQLFGTVRGGLAYAVIFVGALLAATTGVVAASVISMGLISLPIMLRYGYDRRVASGVIAASGTLAQIIPPSLVLIVMADQLGKSVGDMYEGAFIPGLVLSGLYACYIPGVGLLPESDARTSRWKPSAFVRRTAEGADILGFLAAASVGFAWFAMRHATSHGADFVVLQHVQRHSVRLWHCRGELADQSFFRLPFSVAYRATDHFRDGAAVVSYLSGARHDLHRHRDTDRRRRHGRCRRPIARGAPSAVLHGFDPPSGRIDGQLSAFVALHPAGRRVFSLTFYGVSGHLWVEHLLTSLPGGQVGFLIFVNAFVFILAFFLDFFELAFIIIPLLGPAAESSASI